MTGIANNPARVALLTAMEDALDDGAVIWEEQPATRNSTKRALLEAGFVKVGKGGKAYITEEGRKAVEALAAKGQTAQVALEAATEAPKADAKAKFEAARAEVIKAPKAKAEKPAPKAKPTKAALTAALQSDEFAQAVAALPAANPPEQKAEPVQQAEQPAAAPQEEVLPLHRLVRILHTEYDVGALEAPAYAIIWSAEILADKTDIETAKAALAALNRKRKAAGKVQATPAEDHFLA
jgi:hypothetical protein